MSQPHQITECQVCVRDLSSVQIRYIRESTSHNRANLYCRLVIDHSGTAPDSDQKLSKLLVRT